MPFVAVNCAAIPEHLPESELFSYVPGAFPGIRITEEAKAYLSRMDWPGNVRQLFNICECLAVLCHNSVVDEDLVAGVISPEGNPEKAGFSASEKGPSNELDERSRISDTLAACHYHKGETARSLGMSRSTLWRKLREYGIRA